MKLLHYQEIAAPQKVCFLDARALRTVGSTRIVRVCVCVCVGGGGGGVRGRQFHDRGGISIDFI